MRVHGPVRSHQQAIALGIADADVRAAFRQQDVTDHLAIRREHGDAVLPSPPEKPHQTLPCMSQRMSSVWPGDASKNKRPLRSALPSFTTSQTRVVGAPGAWPPHKASPHAAATTWRA
jgi:hypothetical protein